MHFKFHCEIPSESETTVIWIDFTLRVKRHVGQLAASF